MATTQTNSLTALDPTESLALLASRPFGRIVFTVRALPAVLVVNFTMDGSDVVVRTRADGLLARSVPGSVVAFETDLIDETTMQGWSVVLTGPAHRVSDVAEIERLERLDMANWVAGRRDVWLRISGERITGRRLGPPAVETADGDEETALVGSAAALFG